MAYIGNNVTVQQYAPQIAYFSGNGSTTAFTLPTPVVSAAQVLVHVANVAQNPVSAYSVSGSTLTFTSAPPSGTNNIWVEYTSLQTNTISPSNGTVNTAQFANPPTMPSNGMVNTSWTSSSRPSSPVVGQQGYNTSISAFEFYNGSSWIQLNTSVYSYSASYLLVAGGGGGGGGWANTSQAGGGGAGGLLTGTTTFTSGTTYTATVGSGGSAGGGGYANTAGSGGNSSLTGLTTAVGGGGGGNTTAGGNGGSGGSGATAGSGTAGQGNAGASGDGGGGGAGAAGSGSTPGVGLTSTIITTTIATTYSVGQVSGGSVYFAGGGGGSGSLGGGGAYGGGTNTTGGNGTANTGGGGGQGFASAGAGYNGGTGGSGVVIISVPTILYTGITTGSPSVTTNGSNTVLIFKSSGSYTA